MTSLGTALHELRQAKGVSLDDIARSTRVGRPYLEALESDNLGELPPPVFVKGFIRAYCEFLEASPDEPLRLYGEAVGGIVKPERAHGAPYSPRSPRGGQLAIALALFVALGVGLFGVRFALKGPSPQAPAVPAQPARAPSPVREPSGQRLQVRAVETTWIRVQVDEGQVTEELMQAGAVREWTAARRFVLTVGNAGGLEVDLNGRRMPALGARGAVIQRLVLPAEAQGAGSQ